MTLAAMLLAALELAAASDHPKPQVLKEVTEAEIEAVKAKARPGAVMTGIHRPIDPKLLTKGKWVKLSDGSKVWRLAIRSPKAVGLRLHFVDFHAGQSLVRISTAGDKPESFGPYTQDGYNRDGDFWSDTVFADAVTVEFRPASGREIPIPFKIKEISHLFRSPLN